MQASATQKKPLREFVSCKNRWRGRAGQKQLRSPQGTTVDRGITTGINQGSTRDQAGLPRLASDPLAGCEAAHAGSWSYADHRIAWPSSPWPPSPDTGANRTASRAIFQTGAYSPPTQPGSNRPGVRFIHRSHAPASPAGCAGRIARVRIGQWTERPICGDRGC